MQDLVGNINDFHTKFGFESPVVPTLLADEQMKMRLNFQFEELLETAEAAGFSMCYEQDGDGKVIDMLFERTPGLVISKAKFLDGVVDQVYVALGTAWLCCMPFGEAWRRVHVANMKKKRAERVEESTRKSLFDVVKPSGWTPPNLDDLVGP